MFRAQRLNTNPIIHPDMDGRMGSNINGPSLIRVPDWVPNPLGKYYLYFAHHQGTYIRLAFADSLEGPWQIHSPGVLDLADSCFGDHIASPDVHVLEDRREIRMYYHGCDIPGSWDQFTHLATSTDGLNFTANPVRLGNAYWRVFRWQDHWYTLEMPGVFRRSVDGISAFEQGPTLFTEHMRHSAVLRRGDTLYVFYSNAGDCPESILWTRINLDADWYDWRCEPPELLLAPETDYEGADCPLEPSERDAIHHRAQQLRDPCIFEDEGEMYLLYSVAGEHGIAIARLTID